MHAMLSLPAAALCALCSALVAMAAQLIQEDLTLTRRVGGKVSFSCRGTKQCPYDYVIWFQKRDTGTFTRILRIDKTNGYIYKGYNHPQKDDFTAVNKGDGCDLEIQKVKPSHSASYYCSCWILTVRKASCSLNKNHQKNRNYKLTKVHPLRTMNVSSETLFLSRSVSLWDPYDDYRYYGYLIFGSGTKLYVTGEEVVKPVVSVYPAASSANLEGRSSLLCLASSMFPPLVRFSWKRQKENGPLVEMLPAEAEQLELTESGRTAAILLVHQQENSRYRYRCCVHHEGGRVEAQTEQEVRVPPSGPGPSPYQVKLLCRLYVGLVVKSLVFCCGVSLVMVLRNTAHM
ncbi:immunoglobulin lambda-1 light chain-like [Pungitius pungitius]|uniref:immunoglobulin lambda-1 light chain-like n=1 Tax=Pungitius pungitius TaxID=134920 RepID=UPI002E15221B